MHRIYTRPVYALVLTLIFGISTTFASEPLTIVQLCDTQLGMGGYDHDIDTFNLAVKQINTLEPDLVVICGDLVNTNDDKSFKDFKEINAKFTVPCYLASGNHDVGNEPTTESELPNMLHTLPAPAPQRASLCAPSPSQTRPRPPTEKETKAATTEPPQTHKKPTGPAYAPLS